MSRMPPCYNSLLKSNRNIPCRIFGETLNLPNAEITLCKLHSEIAEPDT